MLNNAQTDYFIINSFTIMISIMIMVIGAVVFKYSLNYLDGHYNKKKYLTNQILLMVSSILLVNSNNLILFFLLFVTSNALLTTMMPHNKQWQQSVNSKNLAQKNFIIASLFLLLGCSNLFYITNQITITDIVNNTYIISNPLHIYITVIPIIIACLFQSAIWPFNKWLLSSLNSPTPTSAIMHAGLVNGGGIILIKFYPLLAHNIFLLNILFLIGLLSTIIGNLFKLVQPNYKNVLACSTSSQMGFMIIQISLGLLPMAVVHLLCHSFFKSYLFLNHGEQANEENSSINYEYNKNNILIGMLIGFISALLFHYVLFGSNLHNQTYLYVSMASFVLYSHIAIQLINIYSNKLSAFILTSAISLLHSTLIKITKNLISSDLSIYPVEINLINFCGILVLLLSWILTEAYKINECKNNDTISRVFKKSYVWALNSSMPNTDTITSTKKGYKYI